MVEKEQKCEIKASQMNDLDHKERAQTQGFLRLMVSQGPVSATAKVLSATTMALQLMHQNLEKQKKVLGHRD